MTQVLKASLLIGVGIATHAYLEASASASCASNRTLMCKPDGDERCVKNHKVNQKLAAGWTVGACQPDPPPPPPPPPDPDPPPPPDPDPDPPSDSEACFAMSNAANFQGDTLRDGLADTSGVLYDGTSHKLKLNKSAAQFSISALGISDQTVFASVADFDGDGWDDFVGVGEGTDFVRIYRNKSFDNLPVDWNNPNDTLTPKFQNVRTLRNNSGHGWRPTVAGDFNGDGKADVFWANANTYNSPHTVYVWLNNGNDSNGNPTFQSPYNAMASGSSPSQLGDQDWGGTSIAAVDYNGDGSLDVLVGSGETTGGAIRIFLNQCNLGAPIPGNPLRPCTNNPKFAYSGYLLQNLNLGGSNSQGVHPEFAYADFDGDGHEDLVLGAPKCCSGSTKLRYYRGKATGGVETTYTAIPHVGAATTVLAADFTLDGKLDLFVGSDNWNYGYHLGGKGYMFTNDGDTQPFNNNGTLLTDYNSPSYDYDVGFIFDYDNDPDGTPDIMIADGNHTSSFYVLPNRVVPGLYAECGYAESTTLSLSEIGDDGAIISGARISLDADLNGGSITVYASNEPTPLWVQAEPCADDANDYCVLFPNQGGQQVRWKIQMCSNSDHTQSPEITSVAAQYEYKSAEEYYQAGVIAYDGVTYIGSIIQPGEAGRYYATNSGLDNVYWEAGAKLNLRAPSTRLIYTADDSGRLRWRSDGSSSEKTRLRTLLQAANNTQAAAVIDWTVSKRFGIGAEKSALGAVYSSTSAIINAPGLPLWYAHASSEERSAVDDFIRDEKDRPVFSLVGSKSGMLHAFRNDPSAISDLSNGSEAWAWIPAEVVGRMQSDYVASLSQDTPRISAYVDGSPTVSDIRLNDGSFKTIAVVNGGYGSRSIFTLDISSSIEAGSIPGPQQLWTAQPGGTDAGLTHSKPVVFRTKIAGAVRFLAVAGSGLDSENNLTDDIKGKVIAAYDASNGTMLWKFKMACPLTSDIVAFETDDDNEPGNVDIDGYVDRVVFADKCGNLYKVDPAQDLSGDWNINQSMGTHLVNEFEDGGETIKQYALFSTSSSTDALGTAAPIAGTLAARSDSTTRIVLFFGTGGLRGHDTTSTNEFYAVYADDGTIRSKMTGSCTSSGCEKFYGGTLVTSEQVITTRSIDPVVGNCDSGDATLLAMRLNSGSSFTSDFEQAIGAGVVSSLYGDAGAVYASTLAGEVIRIGTPRAVQAGGDSATGSTGGTGSAGDDAGSGNGSGQPLTLMGWNQVY